MKKGTFFKLLSVIVLAGLVVWSTPNARTRNNDIVRIGILQLSDHGALEDSRLGFVHRLEELGFIEGENIEFNWLNAQNDQANLPLMAESLVSARSDLILAISTPAAQAVANATSEIPILGTPLSSFVAANLVESDEMPNTNVTGTSALPPVARQLDLLDQLVPNVQTIGFLYNSSEVNAQLQIEIARKEAARLGWETVTMTVANTNDINQALQALLVQVDAIYVPADNTISSAIATVGGMAKEARMPVITGSSTAALTGGLATVGLDFYDLGRQTADMAVEIFQNGARPQTMPIQSQEATDIIINKETAEAIGIVIPENLRGE